MNIKSEDLSKILTQAKNNGQLDPVWIILGEEPLLAQEAGDALRSAASELGYSERTVLALGANSDWSVLMDALTSVSLFDDKKIIEVRFISAGPGVKGGKTLAEFSKMAPNIEGIVTMLHLTQVDYATQKTAWFKALAACGHVVTCQPVSRNLYPRWISNRLRQQKQSMSMEALNFFAEQTEGNLLAAKQELMKLSLLYPQRELSLQEVENSVMNVSRYGIEDLIEAIGLGDVARVSRTVNGMQAEDEPLPFILMRLSSLIRDSIAVSENRQAPIMPSMRMHVSKLASRCSTKKLTNALDRCADLDRLAKGLTVNNRGEVWAELRSLCVFLAHVPHRN